MMTNNRQKSNKDFALNYNFVVGLYTLKRAIKLIYGLEYNKKSTV